MSLDIFNTNSPEWMHHEGRNCAIPDEFTPKEAGVISDMWFPSGTPDARYAKRLCDGCPVVRQCFMYALNRPELEGIWGQTTTGQRVKLRTQRKRAAA